MVRIVVVQFSPKELARVRFLHHPQMTKEEILKEIDNKKKVSTDFIEFGYLLNIFLVNKDCVLALNNYIGQGLINVGSEDNNFDYFTPEPKLLAKKFCDKKILNDTGFNITILGLINMINRSFEMIVEYAKNSGQEKNLYNLDWYGFASLIRNAFSHDLKIDFYKHGNKKEMWPDTSLNFSGGVITLNQSMHNRKLDFTIFPIQYSYELVDIMKKSLKDDLN